MNRFAAVIILVMVICSGLYAEQLPAEERETWERVTMNGQHVGYIHNTYKISPESITRVEVLRFRLDQGMGGFVQKIDQGTVYKWDAEQNKYIMESFHHKLISSRSNVERKGEIVEPGEYKVAVNTNGKKEEIKLSVPEDFVSYLEGEYELVKKGPAVGQKCSYKTFVPMTMGVMKCDLVVESKEKIEGFSEEQFKVKLNVEVGSQKVNMTFYGDSKFIRAKTVRSDLTFTRTDKNEAIGSFGE